MKKPYFSVLTGIITAVFTITVLLLVTGIISDYKKGPNEAEYNFNKLSHKIEKSCMNYSFNTKQFNSAFEQVLQGTTPAPISVKLYTGTTVVYQWPNKSDSEISSSLVRSFSAKLNTNADTDIILTATFYILQPIAIYKRARIAFLIILCGTIIAALFILYLTTMQKKPLKDSEIQEVENAVNDLNLSEEEFYIPTVDDIPFENKTPVDDDTKEEPDNIQKQPKTESADEQLDTIPENNISNPVTQTDNTLSENPILSEQKTETPEPEADKKNVGDDSDSETTIPEEKENTDSEDDAYSITTGISKETFLLARLDNELVRAASSEMDLCLFIFQIKNLDYKSSLSKNIVNSLLSQFQFKDMLFEYKNDGFAAILQQADLDSAYSIAENLYAEITGLLKNEESNLQLAIGISARSLRLITGDRLLLESAQAAAHADEKNPIVAFRVDPEKYRKFITES